MEQKITIDMIKKNAQSARIAPTPEDSFLLWALRLEKGFLKMVIKVQKMLIDRKNKND